MDITAGNDQGKSPAGSGKQDKGWLRFPAKPDVVTVAEMVPCESEPQYGLHSMKGRDTT